MRSCVAPGVLPVVARAPTLGSAESAIDADPKNTAAAPIKAVRAKENLYIEITPQKPIDPSRADCPRGSCVVQ